jgi:hypothetical protein
MASKFTETLILMASKFTETLTQYVIASAQLIDLIASAQLIDLGPVWMVG